MIAAARDGWSSEREFGSQQASRRCSVRFSALIPGTRFWRITRGLLETSGRHVSIVAVEVNLQRLPGNRLLPLWHRESVKFSKAEQMISAGGTGLPEYKNTEGYKRHLGQMSLQSLLR